MAGYALLAGALGGLLFAAFAEITQFIRQVGRGTAVPGSLRRLPRRCC